MRNKNITESDAFVLGFGILSAISLMGIYTCVVMKLMEVVRI